MSKVDAQRALREAKYARTKASGPSRREAAATGGRSPATGAAAVPDLQPADVTKADSAKTASAKAASAAAPIQGERCGHKSMNGRTCTRAAGHPEKSHRYS